MGTKAYRCHLHAIYTYLLYTLNHLLITYNVKTVQIIVISLRECRQKKVCAHSTNFIFSQYFLVYGWLNPCIQYGGKAVSLLVKAFYQEKTAMCEGKQDISEFTPSSCHF